MNKTKKEFVINLMREQASKYNELSEKMMGLDDGEVEEIITENGMAMCVDTEMPHASVIIAEKENETNTNHMQITKSKENTEDLYIYFSTKKEYENHMTDEKHTAFEDTIKLEVRDGKITLKNQRGNFEIVVGEDDSLEIKGLNFEAPKNIAEEIETTFGKLERMSSEVLEGIDMEKNQGMDL